MSGSTRPFPSPATSIRKAMLLTAILMGAVFMPGLAGQSTGETGKSAHPSHYEPSHFPKRAGMFYGSVWGVDSLDVKAVESGELIRFTYRILDPEKAKILNDKKVDAFLEFPKNHVRLVIPTMEKVGQLRQAKTPQAGRTYWMAFSNPRRTVKRGDRVNIVIGRFHADNLVVE
jgi:hypothetical protein